MTHLGRLLAISLLTIAAHPAFAADPVYPPGIRVGVVPLEGLARAETFGGFEAADHGVKVLMTELPAAAFSEVETAVKAGQAAAAGAIKPESIETSAGTAYYTAESAKVGAANVRRYSMILPGGTFSGYIAVQVPETAAATFSDDAIKKMLATAVVRKEVPVDEQLALLPFKVSDLSDFRTVRTLAPGAAILLGDGTDETKFEAAPFMILGAIGTAPEKPDDRGRFAQQAAAQIPGLRDGRITMSEPVRIDGAPGFETRVDAISGKDNIPVTVVQWLRFGSGSGALRIIASTPRDQFAAAFPRFRAVRDGIQSR